MASFQQEHRGGVLWRLPPWQGSFEAEHMASQQHRNVPTVTNKMSPKLVRIDV